MLRSQLPLFLTLSYFGFIIYVLFLERRKPTTTMAWISVLFLVPFVGVILYIFFGKDMSRRKVFIAEKVEQRKMAEISRQRGVFLPDDATSFRDPSVCRHLPLLHMNLKSAVAIYSEDNEVEIMTDGREKFNRLFSAMRRAREQIHIEYFIVKNDILGNQLAGLLAQKAREGVVVRLLLDDLGSRLSRARIREMEEAGVQVRRFFPNRIFPFPEILINHRNHRKLVVIDGTEAFLGGFNVGEEYIGLKKNRGAWRDTHLILRGSAVLEVQNRFILDWRTTRQDYRDEDALLFPETRGRGDVGIQIVSSGPESQIEQVKYSYLAMINRALRSIYIQTPYFVPDESLFDALRIALLKGVDVHIMIPNRPDHVFVYWATYSYIGDLLPLGLQAYIYDEGFLHAKTMVIDDEIFSCGSANFDIRSFRLNFETNAFIYDQKVAGRYRRIFEEDIEKSRVLTLEEYQKRPLSIRLREPVSRLVSPLL